MMNFDTQAVPLSHALADVLRRFAQLAHTSSWDQWAVQRLTPTQRKILQLLGSRGESMSLSAVARELGVTAATACDSVSALESKKLVCKQRSATDGRALALELTEQGRDSATALASLPDPLWGAFDALDEKEQETLYRFSIKMLHSLQQSGALPASRMCIRCKFFDPSHSSSPSAAQHYCHRMQSPFSERQLRIDCSVFEVADAAKQEMLWERFAGHQPKKTESVEDVELVEETEETAYDVIPPTHEMETVEIHAAAATDSED
jgi:DNA-binding MarR family transcriptional regulator